MEKRQVVESIQDYYGYIATHASIREFYIENYGRELSDEDIDALSLPEKLLAYLNWEGIIGYTNNILSLFEQQKVIDKNKTMGEEK